MDHSKNFITIDQLQKSINIPFSDISEYLDSFVYFKGLVKTTNDDVIYVDGYFNVGETEMSFLSTGYANIDYYVAEPDTEPSEIVIDMLGCEFSNNESLKGKSVRPKSLLELKEVFFSYSQLSDLMKKLGCPPPKDRDILVRKDFSYDVALVNQKSNFTLDDAAKIAANTYTTSPTQNKYPVESYLYTHYLELLSDCVKGTDQHNFKLHTVELWTKGSDDYCDTFSSQYENGTYLKQQAVIDFELTIISKQEFVRWCNYANIDTGLTYEIEFPIESIEALQHENEKLKKEIYTLKADKSGSNSDKVQNKVQKEKVSVDYPPELQLAIDIYEQYVMTSQASLTNSQINNWLDDLSRERKITHMDQGKPMNGLSEKKKSVIASIVKGN